MNITVNALAKKLDVDYATAGALVKLMEAQGVCKKVGQQPAASGKGKPSTIYEIPATYTIDFTKSGVAAA